MKQRINYIKSYHLKLGTRGDEVDLALEVAVGGQGGVRGREGVQRRRDDLHLRSRRPNSRKLQRNSNK